MFVNVFWMQIYGNINFIISLQIDSAMSMTPYSDEFMEAKVNNIYRGDPNLGGSGVFVNLTIKVTIIYTNVPQDLLSLYLTFEYF